MLHGYCRNNQQNYRYACKIADWQFFYHRIQSATFPKLKKHAKYRNLHRFHCTEKGDSFASAMLTKALNEPPGGLKFFAIPLDKGYLRDYNCLVNNKQGDIDCFAGRPRKGFGRIGKKIAYTKTHYRKGIIFGENE